MTDNFLSYIGWTVGTLLPIINPISAAGMLIGITGQLSIEERNRQITMACIYMTAILLSFLLAGVLIMDLFGISIPGLRIAGGLIVAFLGFRMLFPHEGTLDADSDIEARQKMDISFTPLAMPGLSGPGSIALVITMSTTVQESGELSTPMTYLVISIGIVITALIIWVCLRAAGLLNRWLGANGIAAISRIMGFLMVCIGVQFAINGVRDLLHDPEFWPQSFPPAVTTTP
ncbi:MarC family NAAT transporter [Dongia mobilis]|jgi:multiple antibiotic resistance protein|uniref:MarC family NAAT transporter n=1 Tax=Dongia sp. TaxID=1977262 RepID=UPI0026EFCDF7